MSKSWRSSFFYLFFPTVGGTFPALLLILPAFAAPAFAADQPKQPPPIAAPEFCAPQMVAMPVPDCDPLAMRDRLLRDHRIEMPFPRWAGRSFARLSVQGYNAAPEMDLLCAALASLFAAT